MTGVILSGGKNSRMGANKAFLEFEGERLIDRSVRLFRELFDEVIVVTNEPGSYLDLDVTIVSDVIKGKGPLGGIYTGIFYASFPHAFVAACDMPFLNRAFIEYMIGLVGSYDIVVPHGERAGEMEPLHAIYAKSCLPPIKNLLEKDELKIIGFYQGLKVQVIPELTAQKFDPEKRMFLNANTKEDLEAYRKLFQTQ